MTGHQIQAVRTEYLRLATEAAQTGKQEAAQAFTHAAEILLQARLDSIRAERAEARAFIAARQPATA
jgi:hypothetical protein